uniref:Secreted protein n=1 Tax=Arundo donax TaxID=35708 RepID=A0A0A8ZPT0_ARUDO
MGCSAVHICWQRSLLLFICIVDSGLPVNSVPNYSTRSYFCNVHLYLNPSRIALEMGGKGGINCTASQ